MASPVFFSDLRATPKYNLFDKLDRLLDLVGFDAIVQPKDLAAIKLHFGERGNTAFIRPLFLRHLVDRLKRLKARPFLTDANTLYVGTRSDSVSHLNTAIANGFAYSVVGAPLIIADGMLGSSHADVPVHEKHFQTVAIASEIYFANTLVSVAHFKGHELTGFGGTLKNLGMGCASRKGKLEQHSNVRPFIREKKCIGCQECLEHCAQTAISLMENEKCRIDPEKCVGCGECILICAQGAIQIKFNEAIPVFLEKMVEYTKGVLAGKTNKAVFLNFLTNIAPACDCYSHSDAPIVGDIGIVASKDPVAVDQASVDLVNRSAVQAGSALDGKTEFQNDKFRGLYPQVDWEIQLDYAQNLGLGKRDYELITVDMEKKE